MGQHPGDEPADQRDDNGGRTGPRAHSVSIRFVNIAPSSWGDISRVDWHRVSTCDRSDMSDQRAGEFRRRLAASENNTPLFWNCATRWMFPPPTMYTLGVSVHCFAHQVNRPQVPPWGGAASLSRKFRRRDCQSSSAWRPSAPTALARIPYLAPSMASVLISPTRPSLRGAVVGLPEVFRKDAAGRG